MAGHGPGGLGPRGFLTDEEKKNMPKVTKGLIKRILSYLRPYWVQFLLVFLAILLSATVGLLPSIITGRIVDEALVGRNMKLLIQLLLAAFCTLAISQIIGVMESYINAWISQRIIFDMRNQMYNHLQHMPHAFFTAEKQGDIITRMNTDISGVSSVISGTLSSIVSNVATVVTTLVALFTMSWQLALVGLVVIPLLILPTRSVGKTRWKLLSESQEKNDEMNQLVNETLSVSGQTLVKLFGKEEYEYGRYKEVNGRMIRLNIKESMAGRWFFMIISVFSSIGPMLLYLVGGILMMQYGQDITVGDITVMVALLGRMYGPVNQLLNIQVEWIRSMALFTRIFEYFDLPVEIENAPDALTPSSADGSVEFSHVDFSYDAERQILHDVSFTLQAGRSIAIVGPSGSGKSTIINLIPRLYDCQGGEVRFGGVNVKKLNLQFLRKNVGIVSQETYLFNGTIRENLLYAKPDATEAELIAACKKANIYDFVLKQEQGLDAMVGNRGLKLSGGEKQRLSIARVLLKNPALLIFDEATSALDSISEAKIQEAIEPIIQERTSILIAHRLSTILAADEILVVKDGRIVERGAHAQLVKAGGTYTELYETQFKKALEVETA